MEVGPGECLALFGPPSSGKSTLLRCFNRLVEPEEGRVNLNGADLRKLDLLSLRRHVGFVPRGGGLVPHWNVLENVALVPGLLGKRQPRTLAYQALERVELDPNQLGPRLPFELTEAERLRVAVARAIAGKPVALLLDEPFASADPMCRAELQRCFRKLRFDLHVTTLFATADIAEAWALADRIAVLSQGLLLQVDRPEQLLAAPATTEVDRLLQRARFR